MVAAVQVLDSVGPSILKAAKQQGACGLLVGMRDGSTTLVTAALHCEADDLATARGEACGVAGASPPRCGSAQQSHNVSSRTPASTCRAGGRAATAAAGRRWRLCRRRILPAAVAH